MAESGALNAVRCQDTIRQAMPQAPDSGQAPLSESRGLRHGAAQLAAFGDGNVGGAQEVDCRATCGRVEGACRPEIGAVVERG